MRTRALATDYDGTLAAHGCVDAETIAALEALRGSGRTLVMVTGREVEDLLGVFERADLFDLIVAENGALLYRPRERRVVPLAEPPPPAFVAELRRLGVSPLSLGRVIVATVAPHEIEVMSVIRDMGLEMQVIFNKGAVMVLPSGVNKATGLTAGMRALGLPLLSTVAVGDAENDHALLDAAGCGVAVANAVPTLARHASYVTRGQAGAGVRELIGMILADDLAGLAWREA